MVVDGVVVVVVLDCDPLKAAVEPIAVPVADVPFDDDVVVALFTEVESLEEGTLADAAGAGVLAEVPGMVEEVEEVVVSFGAFLSLCMSPRANAEPLARATMVVITKAGASLRIWSS